MTTRNKQKKKNMKEEQWEKEFDKKFVPKYPKSGFEPIDGLTANVFTIKQFISTIFKTQRQEIIEIGDKMKKEIDDSDYFGISNDHRKQQKILNKQGYNNAISDYQTLIKTLTKQK